MTAVIFETALSFFVASSLIRCVLEIFLIVRDLLIPFVLVFYLVKACFLPLEAPLNFLFFCFVEVATLGIVDNVI